MEFGCPVAYLESPRVRRHLRRPSADDAIHTFSRGEVEIVSLPGGPDVALSIAWDDLDELLAITSRDADPASRIQIHNTAMDVLDEPAELAVVDEQTLQQRLHVPAAFVHNPSPAVLDMLRGAVSPSEWRAGGGDATAKHRIGALAGGVLVALATADEPIGRLTRLRVIVAPSHRRRGLGLTVLHALSHRLIVEGLLPFSRLTVQNAASRALAGAVGFVHFARSLTLRVLPASTPRVHDESSVDR